MRDQFRSIMDTCKTRLAKIGNCPASDTQAMTMIAEVVAPVVAYSSPLGIYDRCMRKEMAGLLMKGAKGACGVPNSADGAWALLDREDGGLGAVDVHETVVRGVADRLIESLSDEGCLGLMARRLLVALLDQTQYVAAKKSGKVRFHQIMQIANLAKEGFNLGGKLKDLWMGMGVENTSEVRVVEMGGELRGVYAEEYMPLWFELGIDRLDALASTDGNRLMGVGEFKRFFGATTAQVNAYKRLCSNKCVGGEKLKVSAKAEAWTGDMLKLLSPVTSMGKDLEGQRTLWDSGAMERHVARSEELREQDEREDTNWS